MALAPRITEPLALAVLLTLFLLFAAGDLYAVLHMPGGPRRSRATLAWVRFIAVILVCAMGAWAWFRS